MSDSKPQNDPSMDDILASIRKIISDDEARAAGPGFGMPTSAPPHRAMQPAPPAIVADILGPAAPADDDDVLLLTDLVEEPPPLGPGMRPLEAATTGVEPQAAPSPGISPIPSPARPAVMDIDEPQPPTAGPSRPMAPPSGRDAASKAPGAPERPNRTVTAAEQSPVPPAAATQTAVSGKSVEDLVREMLRPMLQEWMDKNLPGMVEKHLKSEIDRIPRR